MEDGKGGGWKRGQQRAYVLCLLWKQYAKPVYFPFSRELLSSAFPSIDVTMGRAYGCGGLQQAAFCRH